MMIHVVTGPPCAGKTTFVNNHKADGDIVIDFDDIAVALGSSSRHDHASGVKNAAMAARDAAIAAIGDNDAWIVHTRPTPEQRESYGDAVFHDLDPGIDECLSRMELDNRPP